jgi:hypothetical protein
LELQLFSQSPQAEIYVLSNLQLHDGQIQSNVRGEPVFSVMAASWFCENSGQIRKVEDLKLVLFVFLKRKDFN